MSSTLLSVVFRWRTHMYISLCVYVAVDDMEEDLDGDPLDEKDDGKFKRPAPVSFDENTEQDEVLKLRLFMHKKVSIFVMCVLQQLFRVVVVVVCGCGCGCCCCCCCLLLLPLLCVLTVGDVCAGYGGGAAAGGGAGAEEESGHQEVPLVRLAACGS